jgi:phosphoribosylformimino-5-aminoimidazole carboxamide ribonucleotide (ProFAR) isomerase
VRTETKIQTVEVEKRVVEKQTETKTVTVNHCVEHTVKRPDGTVETVNSHDTVTTIAADTHLDATTSGSKTSTEDTSRVEVTSRPDWMISGTAALSGTGVSYGVDVHRRVLGPIFAGAFVETSKRAGLSLGVEF